jgi:acetoin utilization deacetylase AcuC-like enzyme
VVVSTITLEDLKFSEDEKMPIVSDDDTRCDALDTFNHPRIRRCFILQALSQLDSDGTVTFQKPDAKMVEPLTDLYKDTQNTALLQFFHDAWQKWVDLGDGGRDPLTSLPTSAGVPPLIPGVMTLPRESRQRPSDNVMGQIGYYCTDTCTPIFDQLLDELQWDAAIIHQALHVLHQETSNVVYALPTHPGHHAAQDSFGGFCYLNQAAHAAQVLRQSYDKVAVLDIDYHCGNGTASIFYDRDDVMVCSIHCHPEWDYPFHSGYTDENKPGSTLHLPLLPGANWEDHYKPALQQGLDEIFGPLFGAQALVVSLGLDTLQGDPVTLRRAGFDMLPEAYRPLGELVGTYAATVPCLVVQEGGYKMDQLGLAAADVIMGIAQGKTKAPEGHE